MLGVLCIVLYVNFLLTRCCLIYLNLYIYIRFCVDLIRIVFFVLPHSSYTAVCKLWLIFYHLYSL